MSERRDLNPRPLEPHSRLLSVSYYYIYSYATTFPLYCVLYCASLSYFLSLSKSSLSKTLIGRGCTGIFSFPGFSFFSFTSCVMYCRVHVLRILFFTTYSAAALFPYIFIFSLTYYFNLISLTFVNRTIVELK